MYKYGINLLLWTSNFTNKDLYLLKKVKECGCDVVEIPIFNPEVFPSEDVKNELEKNDDIILFIDESQKTFPCKKDC